VATKRTKREMTDEHKAAIASGRSEGAAVKRYLEELQRQRRPGRRVTKLELEDRLARTEQQILVEENPLTQLELRQQVLDLKGRIAASETKVDTKSLEADFVKIAKAYANRKQISYTAFREMGVPAQVLKKAGIPQERQRRS